MNCKRVTHSPLRTIVARQARLRAICWTLVVLAFSGIVRADGGPENVLVVVNEESPDSLAIANHYVDLRHIPATNVVYLTGIPDTRQCSYAVFKARIGDPVIQAIDARQLADHIDYIAFSAGFPTVVNCPAHLKTLQEKVPAADGRVFKSQIATTALMTFWLYAANNDVSFMLLDANWYACRTEGDPLEQPFFGPLDEKWKEGVAALDGDPAKAVGIFSEFAREHPRQVAAHYQLARALARESRGSEAALALRRAVELGWQYRRFTNDDPHFAPLSGDADFQAVVDSMGNVPYGRVPTRGFDSGVAWGRNGWPNATPDQGKRLWLSTMLGITGGTRGSTRDQVIAQLQRSVGADGTRPTGIFYFTRTRDVRTTVRKPQFALAIEELQELGHRADEVPDVLPKIRANVLGATIGAPNPDWGASGSEFAPGALCDNLTSAGGIMVDNGPQTPLTHFLEHGAAGASGTVCEPLAIPAKFPDARLHVHYARGCNLAESFYQAVSGPFQLLIAGDPLCQPWARFPRFEMSGINDGDFLEGHLELTLDVPAAGQGNPGVSVFEVYIDGRRTGEIRAPGLSRIPLEGLSDGWHELRIVAVDDTLIGTRASKLTGFFLAREAQQVELELPGTGEHQLARSVLVRASASFGESISIRHNYRTVATIDGRSGEARIDCAWLGAGPVSLRAVVEHDGKTVSSAPQRIVINP